MKLLCLHCSREELLREKQSEWNLNLIKNTLLSKSGNPKSLKKMMITSSLISIPWRRFAEYSW